MKKSILLISCLLFAFCVFAQNKVIAGTVTNDHAYDVTARVVISGTDTGVTTCNQNISFSGVPSNDIFLF